MFKELQRIDRALFDLTLRVAFNIRSVILAQGILMITQKLRALLQDKLPRSLRSIGLPMAQRLSKLAQEWGNGRAHVWVSEIGFIHYLAVMSIDGQHMTGQ